MAQIDFYSQGFQIGTSGGSGLGFYGSGNFATSIPVGSVNSYTYITSSSGTSSGNQVNNTAYASSGSGSINGSGNLALTAMPNYLMPANIRFSHSSAVRCTNAQLRVYDRNSIDAGPTGVIAYVASIIHSATAQTNTGSGSSTWTQCSGSGSVLTMATSPGTSGLSPSGSSTTDTRHDWYAAVSLSPTSVGSKLSAIYFSTEYL